MRSALRQLCRHGIEALRPQKVNDRWRKPVISRRVAADLRKVPYAGRTVEVEVDNRDIRGGDKTWQWIKKGIPVRVEVGPRDGLQNEKTVLEPAVRADFVQRLEAAGCLNRLRDADDERRVRVQRPGLLLSCHRRPG
mgnify:CR=1 FL=1